MPDLQNKFSRRSNQNLLQLWKGRDRLRDSDIDPLRDEFEKRGLQAEAEKIEKHFVAADIYGHLPPPPQTYGNLSVPFWWLREIWLRHKTKDGPTLEGKIKSAQRTASGYRSAGRAQLLYTFEFQGRHYSGRVVRDFVYGSAAADSLAYDNHPGEKVPILINPDNPEISYYPSGFGFVQPIVIGITSLFGLAVFIAVVIHLALR